MGVLRRRVELSIGGKTLMLGERPLLMGIINVTPDSFSDGGAFLDAGRAIEHGLRLLQDGADWLDVGGESTRPGAAPVPADEEMRRVLPVIKGLARQTNVPLSIDTYKAETARAALDAGATTMNDVTGFRDPAMVEVAMNSNAACIVMHMRGAPLDMMSRTAYEDVVAELLEFFRERIVSLTQSGIESKRLIVDPGIGFAKLRPDNLRLLNSLADFHELDRPLALGASRKRIIGEVTGKSEAGRLAGTIATSILAYQRGVHVLRVHDVAAVKDALAMARAIEEEGSGAS